MAANQAINHVEADFDKIVRMKKPDDLDVTQWTMVLQRCREMQQHKMGIRQQESVEIH